MHGSTNDTTGKPVIAPPTPSRARPLTPWEKENLLRDPDTDEQTIRALASDIPEYLSLTLVAHPRCPTDLKLWLLRDSTAELAARIIDSTPELDAGTLTGVAMKTSASPGPTLHRVAAELYAAVARHPNVSVDMLRVLAGFAETREIGAAVLNNPHSNADVQRAFLRAASGDKTGATLVRLATHPRAATSVLDELAWHDMLRVRTAVASNPKTSPSVLGDMLDAPGAGDPLASAKYEQSIIVAAAANPSMPTGALQDRARRTLERRVEWGADDDNAAGASAHVFDALARRLNRLGIHRGNKAALTYITLNYDIDSLAPDSPEIETVLLLHPDP